MQPQKPQPGSADRIRSKVPRQAYRGAKPSVRKGSVHPWLAFVVAGAGFILAILAVLKLTTPARQSTTATTDRGNRTTIAGEENAVAPDPVSADLKSWEPPDAEAENSTALDAPRGDSDNPGRPGPSTVDGIPPTARSAAEAKEALSLIRLKKRRGSEKVAGDGPSGAPAPPEENRFFTLELSGSVGDAPLDPNDTQTWARLSYFLREESPSRFYLVYPNGTIPLAVKGGHAGPNGTLAKGAPAKKTEETAPPTGDTSRPTHRLVLRSTSKSTGKVTFYGRELASKYNCSISCRVEKRKAPDEDFALLQEVSVEEALTPAKDSQDDGASYVRKLYDVAVDKLLQKLGTVAPFRKA